MGPFFSLRSSWLVQGREENFQPSSRPAVHFDTPLYHTKTKLEYRRDKKAKDCHSMGLAGLQAVRKSR
jgi:hypothetical protein